MIDKNDNNNQQADYQTNFIFIQTNYKKDQSVKQPHQKHNKSPQVKQLSSIQMISEQLISLIYGSIVTQVIGSSEHYTEVNARLQKIGFKIGSKLLDEFMRQNPNKACTKTQQLVQRFCNIGIKKFLNPIDVKFNELKNHQNGFSFRVSIIGNPFLKNLQLTPEQKNNGLQYQSIIKGCFRGVFDVMKLKAKVTIIYEQLTRDQTVYFIEAEKKSEHVE